MLAKEMPSAGERHFLHTFCCRLDKKYGVWRDATRRFVDLLGIRRDFQMIIKKVQILFVLMSCMMSFVAPSYSIVDDGKLVDLARRELKTYLESRPTASEWEISVQADNKIVTTNWYREHKGEVILKVEVRVHDGLVRVDVWQRVGYLFHSAEKTDWSRKVEWEIQKLIEQARKLIELSPVHE